LSRQEHSKLAVDGCELPLSCPVCLRPDIAFYASGQDRLFQKAAGDFKLYRCASCGSIFQHPAPAQADIAAFYPEQYWWSKRTGEKSSVAQLMRHFEQCYREWVNQGHVRFLERCAQGNGTGGRSLLDIGCGNGTFLHLARARGFIPHGMDMSEQAVAIARDQYGLDVRQGEIGGDAWQGRRFDFVTLFHVLEHLPEPEAALQFIRTLLAPGGSLIVQVPNAASLQARVFKGRWYGLDVPRHIINFTPESLRLLLERSGYEVRSTCRFSLRDNPASLASSLAPVLDPIGRKGRSGAKCPATEAVAEIAYLILFMAAIPLAWVESACGFGGTVWIQAMPIRSATE
jgi:2-polyprenyl-3-methyl-5-hydroxy-6-metoxy-1,4-benzoquinol methylase